MKVKIYILIFTFVCLLQGCMPVCTFGPECDRAIALALDRRKLHSPDPAQRAGALLGLGRNYRNEIWIVEAIEIGLSDDDYRVRGCALMAIKDHIKKEATHLLSKIEYLALNDDNEEVRKIASNTIQVLMQ